ncbi:DUF4197 domain-containing protein [Qipengyuania sp. JC766]|uniref:DUF4197 domain-containing protein n=1 Tax=Qipengyuania sp. JC766 TaxID=3232139 RepID=UPI0034580F65
MSGIDQMRPHGRRAFLVGASATGLVFLGGCQGMGGYSLTDAVRRLLFLSSERAFARLTAPDGFWDRQVAQVGLGNILGTRGDILAGVLTSTVFKRQLEDAFADVAIRGAERAAPLVADAVRLVGFDAAEALIRGGPTAATGFLRGELGDTLVQAMVPELGDAMRIANNPAIGQVISGLTGVDVAGIANRFGSTINDAIWQEMGTEEAAIRRDPRSTNDPVLIGVLGVGSRL